MAGKHAAASSGSKKPLIIVIIAVLAAAIIGVGGFFAYNFFTKDNNKKDSSPASSSSQTQNSNNNSSSAVNGNSSVIPPSTEAPAGTEEAPTVTEYIQIPTNGGEITYFNATYIPNGEVIDLSTGANATLREVFGQGFANGTITFNDDGTFYSNLDGSGAQTGMYLVEEGVLSATYSTDRNLDITVTEWDEDGKTPVEFYIIVGEETNGYKVFFSGN